MSKFKTTPLLLAVAFYLVALLPSCGDDDDAKVEKVTADFTYQVDTETKGKVTFKNTSTNAKTYAWDFGDGNTSDAENPTHTYDKDSTYTVKLTATNGAQSHEATKTINLTEGTNVVAGFIYKKDTETPGKIAFTNTSTNAKTYAWDFGDGGTSNAENPTHTYKKDSTYTVTLIATNDGQSDEEKQTLTTALIPTITLKGEASVSIKIGATYTDAGATAVDVFDKVLTDKIVVGGDAVNTLQPGTYAITYDVEDEKGNKAIQVTRTVTVIFSSGSLTNGDFQTGDGTGWALNGGVTVKTEEGNSYLSANGGTDSVNVNAHQSFKGKGLYGNTYHLSFNASAAAAKTIGVGFGEGIFKLTKPSQIKYKTFDLSTEIQRFTYEMTIVNGGFDSRPDIVASIFFMLGGKAGSVKIDNVAFEFVEKGKFVTQLPADFEDGAIFDQVTASFIALSNVANPDKTGNPSANVLKVTRGRGAFKFITQFGNQFSTSLKQEDGLVFKLKVWSHKKNARVEFKLTGLSGTVSPAALHQNVAAAETWEELTFDFSKVTKPDGTPFTLADGYNTILINPDENGAETAMETFYFDDIRQDK